MTKQPYGQKSLGDMFKEEVRACYAKPKPQVVTHERTVGPSKCDECAWYTSGSMQWPTDWLYCPHCGKRIKR